MEERTHQLRTAMAITIVITTMLHMLHANVRGSYMIPKSTNSHNDLQTTSLNLLNSQLILQSIPDQNSH